jgi:hypothetical protein
MNCSAVEQRTYRTLIPCRPSGFHRDPLPQPVEGARAVDPELAAVTPEKPPAHTTHYNTTPYNIIILPWASPVPGLTNYLPPYPILQHPHISNPSGSTTTLPGGIPRDRNRPPYADAQIPPGRSNHATHVCFMPRPVLSVGKLHKALNQISSGEKLRLGCHGDARAGPFSMAGGPGVVSRPSMG